MCIGLWAARVERPLTQREAELLLRFVPQERRGRLRNVRLERKRQEVLCAYALLRTALRDTLGWEALPEMAKTQHGKPFFPDAPAVHFNLSHTDGAVLAGLSDQPIGVDIERIRPMSVKTMERLAQASTPEAFFACWVRREARGKRIGSGLAAMLGAEAPMQQGEFYHRLQTFPGYAAGAAVGGTQPPPAVRVCALEELIIGS